MGTSLAVGKRARVLLRSAVAGGLVFGSWWLVEVGRYRAALAECRAELRAGRPVPAARKLAALLEWRPDSDEAAYLLGVCERARGRDAMAAEAWARVPSSSLFAAPAVRGRAEVLVDQGRFADAERLLNDALADPRIAPDDLRRYLAPLYLLEGRFEDARRIVEASWEYLDQTGRGDSGDALELARRHIALSIPTTPSEATRALLGRAARLAPQDDRVWLARANLAIRQGAFDEAARWLDACVQRRPDDVPVWRARLNWALATGRVTEVRAALAHLPIEDATPAQVHRLAAWLAACRGDAEAEQRAWERLVTVDPSDDEALDRLAALADQRNQPARAAELHQRKAQLAQIKHRFQILFQRNQPIRDAAELARLAERLGWFFEARAFLTVAVANAPDRADLRDALTQLPQRETPVAPSGRTWADALASELEANPARPHDPAAPRNPVFSEKPSSMRCPGLHSQGLELEGFVTETHVQPDRDRVTQNLLY
jgi:tetratricopeptide (TPR) repeat protein